ncbi:MAG: spondin domain-containing protein, partial [Longimicrobiales bacterium]
ADVGDPDPDTDVRLADDAFGNLPAVSDMIRLTLTSTGPTSWRARIENVSTAATLSTSDGGMHPVPLSPGVFVVHADADPLFTAGTPDRGEGLEAIAEDGAAADLSASLAAQTGVTGVLSPGAWAVHTAASVLFSAGSPDRGDGLEAVAEDGSPGTLAASLNGHGDVVVAGAFDTPVGAAAPGPLTPGGSYTFTVTAEEGQRLSLATMYVQSNDLFYAPAEPGIDLFPNGIARNGDVTGMILLWDAGTEVNERPGVGLFQAPRQPGPDTGDTENGDVRQASDGYDYGAVEDRIRVTITPVG